MNCQRNSMLTVDLGVDLGSMLPEINQCKRRFQQNLWSTIFKRVLEGPERKEGGKSATSDGGESKDEGVKMEESHNQQGGEATPQEEEEEEPPPKVNSKQGNRGSTTSENRNNLAWLKQSSARSRSRLLAGVQGLGSTRYQLQQSHKQQQKQKQQQQRRSYQHSMRRGSSFDTAAYNGISAPTSRYLPLDSRHGRIDPWSQPQPALQPQKPQPKLQQKPPQNWQRRAEAGAASFSNQNRNNPSVQNLSNGNSAKDGSAEDFNEQFRGQHQSMTRQASISRMPPAPSPSTRRLLTVIGSNAPVQIRSYSAAGRRDIPYYHEYSDDGSLLVDNIPVSGLVHSRGFPAASYLLNGTLVSTGSQCDFSDSESAAHLMTNTGHYVTAYDAATDSSNTSREFCPLTVGDGWAVPRRVPRK